VVSLWNTNITLEMLELLKISLVTYYIINSVMSFRLCYIYQQLITSKPMHSFFSCMWNHWLNKTNRAALSDTLEMLTDSIWTVWAPQPITAAVEHYLFSDWLIGGYVHKESAASAGSMTFGFIQASNICGLMQWKRPPFLPWCRILAPFCFKLCSLVLKTT